MEVILKKDIEGLGEKNELVVVKDGYGRNYLIPQGYAIMATPSMKKMHAENQRQSAHKETQILEQARSLANKLTKMAIKIGAKVGESGKIFGSVNTIQLAEAISALGVEVDRKDIKIKEEPIRSVGKYEAEVKFHKEVIETIEFEVVGE